MLAGGRQARQALNIVDRPLPKARPDVPTVSLSAFAFLFSEIISYAMDRAASVTELEERWAQPQRGRGGMKSVLGAAGARVTRCGGACGRVSVEAPGAGRSAKPALPPKPSPMRCPCVPHAGWTGSAMRSGRA